MALHSCAVARIILSPKYLALVRIALENIQGADTPLGGVVRITDSYNS